jgi:hypothetical protein
MMGVLACIVFVAVLAGLLFGALKLMNKWEEYPHTYKYRNPYDRTCLVCGRNEQEECWADEYARYGMRARGTWTVYREGDGSCEKKKKGVDNL